MVDPIWVSFIILDLKGLFPLFSFLNKRDDLDVCFHDCRVRPLLRVGAVEPGFSFLSERPAHPQPSTGFCPRGQLDAAGLLMNFSRCYLCVPSY